MPPQDLETFVAFFIKYGSCQRLQLTIERIIKSTFLISNFAFSLLVSFLPTQNVFQIVVFLL